MNLKSAVVASKVENGAAGEGATWTGGPEAERTGSERIKSRGKVSVSSAGSFESLSLRSK